jgi:hypothetical protein
MHLYVTLTTMIIEQKKKPSPNIFFFNLDCKITNSFFTTQRHNSDTNPKIKKIEADDAFETMSNSM